MFTTALNIISIISRRVLGNLPVLPVLYILTPSVVMRSPLPWEHRGESHYYHLCNIKRIRNTVIPRQSRWVKSCENQHSEIGDQRHQAVCSGSSLYSILSFKQAWSLRRSVMTEDRLYRFAIYYYYYCHLFRNPNRMSPFACRGLLPLYTIPLALFQIEVNVRSIKM